MPILPTRDLRYLRDQCVNMTLEHDFSRKTNMDDNKRL